MAAADLQRRALRATLARANTAVAMSREKAKALIAAIQDLRQRVNADIDAALFNLETMEAELAAAAVDTTLVADAPARKRQAKVKPQKPQPKPETAIAVHTQEPAPTRRARDFKRAAANDLDELPFEQPRRVPA